MQNEKSHQILSLIIKSLLNPTMAAMIAFAPVYRLFEHKAAAQLGGKATSLPMGEIIKRSAAGTPLIGGIVAVQASTAQLVEYGLNNIGLSNENACKMLSALATGIASVHPLAALNYATSDKSPITPIERVKKACHLAISNTTPKVGICIALKEAGFVGVLIASDTGAGLFKPIIGDNKYAGIALFSFIAALATQPFDTMAVRMQNNMATSAADLMRGGLYRGVAVAAFSCGYSYCKGNMNAAAEYYL